MLHVTQVLKKMKIVPVFFSSVWAIAFFFFFPSRVLLTYFCSNELMFLSQMTALAERKIYMLIQKKKKKRERESERWEELNMGNGRVSYKRYQESNVSA